MRSLLFLILTPLSLSAGSFPATDGISKDSTAFVAWANGNQTPQYGSGVDNTWKTPAKAHGKASGTNTDIVCLGNGGKITLWFPHPIRDGPGADFAVFENGFSDTFLELGFVEVSSDGVNFLRFPNRSEGTAAVGAFGAVDPTTLNGLAGRYRAGVGTPFDLTNLPATPLLDRGNIRFVRIADIIGSGATTDSTGHPIYDPTPTTGSGGFDLEAIGVIYQNDGGFRIPASSITGGGFLIDWESNPGSHYRIETATSLDAAPGTWISLGNFAPSTTLGLTRQLLPMDGADRRFWRIVRLEP